jgi:hypothetical protein
MFEYLTNHYPPRLLLHREAQMEKRPTLRLVVTLYRGASLPLQPSLALWLSPLEYFAPGISGCGASMGQRALSVAQRTRRRKMKTLHRLEQPAAVKSFNRCSGKKAWSTAIPISTWTHGQMRARPTAAVDNVHPPRMRGNHTWRAVKAGKARGAHVRGGTCLILLSAGKIRPAETNHRQRRRCDPFCTALREENLWTLLPWQQPVLLASPYFLERTLRDRTLPSCCQP